MSGVRVSYGGLALALALLLAAAVPAVGTPVTHATSALTAHAPISITGNLEFTAANGVVGGTGTAADPFVIAGWLIDAPTSIGVQIRGTDAHAVVRDVAVTGAPIAGFYTFDVSNVSFANVTAFGSAGDGLRLESSHDVVIEVSNVTANNAGITVLDSFDVTLLGNNITLNRGDGVTVSQSSAITIQANAIAFAGLYGGYGLDLASSTNVTVQGNDFTGNDVYIQGSSAAEYTSHRITADNLVSGLPILYVSNQPGYRVSGLELGELLLMGCTNAEVSATSTVGGDIGIEVAYSTSVTLSPDIAISDASIGLLVVSSRIVFFSNGTILDTGTGVLVESSWDVDIAGSKISAPFASAGPGDGVAVVSSDLVVVFENTIRRHVTGVSVSGSTNVLTNVNLLAMNSRALWFQDSRNLTVFENQVVQDGAGAEVDRVTNATFTLNQFESDSLGVNGSDSSQLRAYFNTFIQDSVSASDTNGSVDAWDNGYPDGGNFWSNYSGVDQCKGPLQNNCTGPDGIGDTPYRFNVNATDRYPLMTPKIRTDVAPEALFYLIPAAGTVLTTFGASANLSSDYEDPLSALQVRWDWTGNGSWTPWSAAKFSSHRYSVPGTYTLRLEVRDTANLTDTWSTDIFVAPKPDNLPPAITISAPASVEIGQPITVVANITDASGVASAAVYYFGVDGGSFIAVPMSIQVNGVNFTATIPAQPHAGTLIFAIVANDTWENQARAPLGGYVSVTVIDPLATFAATILVPALIVAAAVVIGLVWMRHRRKQRAHPPEEPPPPSVPPPGPPGTP